MLKNFYPEASAKLDHILRTMVGMDSTAVSARFAEFAAHNTLSSQQIRFLGLLKNHIRDYGTVEMAQLFEQPFTRIHGEGITGVFNNTEQIVAIKGIVEELSVNLGAVAS